MVKFFVLLIVLFLIIGTYGNVINLSDCDLPSGGRGFCVSLKDCDLTIRQNAFFYHEEFCTENRSKICCKNLKQIEESTTEKVQELIVVTENDTEEVTTQANESTEDYPVDDENTTFPPILNEPLQPILNEPLELNSIMGHPNNNLFDMEKCGGVNCRKRISGGEIAKVLEFPWIALIGYLVNGEIKFNCGGSLISDNYALSASHCVANHFHKVLKNLKLIRLGEHTQSKTIDCQFEDNRQVYCADPVQDIPINSSNVIMHENYDYHNRKNDIALIRLSEPAKISQNNIKPICLPFNPNPFKQKMTVIGFGNTEKTGRLMSDVLMKVVIELRKNDDCNKILQLADPLKLDDKQLCAGDKRNNCNGDSGSPLEGIGKVGKNNEIKKVQYGIVSYGTSCSAGKGEPGVYTNVHSYLAWILDNMT